MGSERFLSSPASRGAAPVIGAGSARSIWREAMPDRPMGAKGLMRITYASGLAPGVRTAGPYDEEAAQSV